MFEYQDPRYGPGVQDGFVAQEVEKFFPKWVVTGDDGYKGIVYGPQVQTHLIGAVKELKAENDSLKRKIAEIEAMLKANSASK